MYKIAILGYGYMGEIRRRVFEERDDCRVTHIYHSDGTVDGVSALDDWRDVLDLDVDFVCLCLPNFLTKDAVVACLLSGKHVFAEKPPGISVAEVEEMITAERETGLRLKFGFNHRYHPAIMRAKELVDSGEYGDIYWIRGRYGKSPDVNFGESWRAKKKLSGGGILMDQGIHMLDLCQHFCGDFEEVKAFASNHYWKGEVEDNVFAIMRNPAGQVASIHSTMTQWRYLFALEIFLERGYLVVNGLLSRSGRYGPERLDWATNRSPSPQASHSEIQSVTFNSDHSWEMEAEEFVSAVRDDLPIEVGNSSDALRLMGLIERIYADAGVSVIPQQ